jgi:CheY-like chemotaxis protein
MEKVLCVAASRLQPWMVVSTGEVQPVNAPTLLVVDDDPDIRMMLCELFGREGYRVETADDGAAAILFLESHAPPAAIVLDLLMPGIVGSSVLSYMAGHRELAEVPVAIVSSSPQLAPEGYRLFKKPLRFASLLEFVRTECDARRHAPTS